MNIGFDAKRAFNNHRGLGNYSRDTIRIMSALFPENRYFLYTPKIDKSISYTCSGNDRIILPDKRIGRLFHSLWRSFGVVSEIEKHNIDVFHGLSHELPWNIEKSKTRSVVTMHDLIFVKQPELYPAFDRQLYRIKYFHSCKIADKVIAVSEQTKRDLIEFVGISESKIRVVYQGCSPIFQQKCTEEKKQQIREKYDLPETFILNVGAVEKRKNQMLILKAMKSNDMDIPLVIVGKETEYAKTLHDFIISNNLQKKVFILHDVDFVDFPALYQSAALFIYPSLSEGFGIPIIEALQSEVPVITSDQACLRESGGAGSRYVSSTDETELADAIEDILNDEVLQQEMIGKGKEHVKGFSDATIAKSLMNVYLSLL